MNKVEHFPMMLGKTSDQGHVLEVSSSFDEQLIATVETVGEKGIEYTL